MRDLQALVQAGVGHRQGVFAFQRGGQFAARLEDAVGQLLVEAFYLPHVARMAQAQNGGHAQRDHYA
ncbi:hypothetical protein D3C73_929700 [compost metagenome]